MDIEVPETRFRGRSQALLYNNLRPHSSLGYQTPAEFIAKLEEQASASKRATGRDAAVHGASAPRPVASPSRKGQSTQPERGAVSS